MEYRVRVKELRRVPARSIIPDPDNPRMHPEKQRAYLRGVLAELGYCDVLICREDDQGQLRLLDGHLRQETTPDLIVPVVIVDLTEEEGKYLTATVDPIAAMAQKDQEALDLLCEFLEPQNSAVNEMLAELRSTQGLGAAPGLGDDDDSPDDSGDDNDASGSDDPPASTPGTNPNFTILAGPYAFDITPAKYFEWAEKAEKALGTCDKEAIRDYALSLLGIKDFSWKAPSATA